MFPRVLDLVAHLRPWATMMAARFSAPVYLTGSTVVKDDPQARDVDIRIQVSEAHFRGRYGISGERFLETLWTSPCILYFEDMAALTDEAVKELGVNLDLYVQPPVEWEKYKNEPRIRLDLLTHRFPE